MRPVLRVPAAGARRARPALAVTAAALLLLPAAAPPAEALAGQATCVGWWDWHWDTPSPGQVTVVSSFVHNACLVALAFAGNEHCQPAWEACLVAKPTWTVVDLLAQGSFVARLVPPGDQCDTFLQVDVDWDDDADLLVTGGVAVAGAGVEPDDLVAGAYWQLSGAFAGHSCLLQPTAGVFTVSVALTGLSSQVKTKLRALS